MAGADVSAASAQLFSGISAHPGEDASAKEDDDWWRHSDAVHFIAGLTPPRLSALDPIDILGYSAVTVPP
eukprot:2336011-Prymnesium_polylepis.1